MFENDRSVFVTLNAVDVSGKVREKNGFNYLPWSCAWSEIKKRYPDANFKVYPQTIDDGGNTRFWHDDGRTAWVTVGVTIDGIEIIETLAIMDFKNKSIAADQVTSSDANRSVKRCLTKACAMHGLGLYIYEGEELPEESSNLLEIRERVKNLVEKKCKLSDKAKSKVAELCKNAERVANPELDEDLITGDYKRIENLEVLTNLEKQLMAVRK